MAQIEDNRIFGIGVSPGIAMARAVLYRPSVITPPLREISGDEAEAEWERLIAAKDITRHQLRDIRDDFGLEAANGEAGIIDAHLLVLDDELIVEDTHAEIFEKHHCAEWAVRDVANKYIATFNSFDDLVFRERANDLADVSRRLMRALMGISEDLSFDWDEPKIVVAENLTPSEALALPRNLVSGVALDRGSLTSHSALLIRALSIPAVFGLGDFSSKVSANDLIAIDGNKGVVIPTPSDDDIAFLRGEAARRENFLLTLKAECHSPAYTADGADIHCFANVENADSIRLISENGADGIGLFRTEYLWLPSGRQVDEISQTRIYAELASLMRDKPLVIRAFDLGGDKFSEGGEFREIEENPFLGLRSIRFLLQNEDVFKVQIRALLRAGALTQKKIDFLLPMISDLSEIVRTKRIIDECIDELREEGIRNCVRPKVGIMIEVPSAALMADVFAQYVDFFSIGSNDLAQYTLAADRNNDAVAYLNQPLHPSVLKLIDMTVKAAERAKIELCVCGEMARNPLHACILLGLHVRNFSMAPSSIPLIKGLIRKLSLRDTERIAAIALSSSTMAQVRHLARDLISTTAPEILLQC